MKKVDELWNEIKTVLQAYSQFFARSTITKELFLWAYNSVMTRCFGCSSKETSIVPFADCLNHSKYHSTHFYVHRQFEKEESKKHDQYNIKKKTIDLSIVDPMLENKKTPQLYQNEILQHIKSFKEDSFFKPSATRTQMIPQLRQLNIKTLQENPNNDVWNVQYFTTSNEEDNNTDSDEEDEKKKQREMNTIKLKENSTMREALEKVRRYEEKLQNQIKQSPQDEEKAREERRKADEAYQQQLLEKQKKKLEQEAKEIKIEDDQEELDLKNLYILNEDEIEWYNHQDEDIFFVFASNKPISQGEQVFNFYGRRTNRYLICWYGFTYLPNEYDSLSFRIFVHKKSEELTEANVKDFIFSDYILYDEWEKGVKIGDKIIPIDILSKEFRLKDGLLCEELINYIRINKMQHYNGQDKGIIMVTQPRSLNFELIVLEAVLIILKELQSRHYYNNSQISNAPLTQGGKNSSQLNSVAHEKFTQILHQGHVNIINRQVALLNISCEILKGIAKGTESYKALYMKLYIQHESEKDYSANREYLRKYLKLLYEGIVLKNNKPK